MNAPPSEVDRQRLELEQYLLKVRGEVDKRAGRLQNLESELQKLTLRFGNLGQGVSPSVTDVGLLGVSSSYRRSLEKKIQELSKECAKAVEELERARERAAEVEEELRKLLSD